MTHPDLLNIVDAVLKAMNKTVETQYVYGPWKVELGPAVYARLTECYYKHIFHLSELTLGQRIKQIPGVVEIVEVTYDKPDYIGVSLFR